MEIVLRGTRETVYMVMLKEQVTETYLGSYTEYRDAVIVQMACERLLNTLKDKDKLA